MNRKGPGHRKLTKLIEKLHAKTVSGDVAWGETSIPDRYLLQLSETGVAISEIEAPLGKDESAISSGNPFTETEKGYELTILNNENKEIESFKIFRSTHGNMYSYAEETFQYASTGFKNIDQAIDAVIEDIEKVENHDTFEFDDDLPF